MEQTCERYRAKPKQMVKPSKPTATELTATAKNTTDAKNVNEATKKLKKRQNEPEPSSTLTKKQRVSESSVNNQPNGMKFV